MKKSTRLLAAMAAACMGASLAVAHDPSEHGQKADNEPLTSSKFVTKAAQAGMLEVELGRVALEKSQARDIRNFADRMVKDHGKANAELMAIAQRENVKVPAELDAKHRAMVDELKGKSDEAFDAAYAHHMSKDHGKAVGLFERASSEQGVDQDLKAFASKTLPTLQEHKQMAEALNTEKRVALVGKDMGGKDKSDSKQHHQ